MCHAGNQERRLFRKIDIITSDMVWYSQVSAVKILIIFHITLKDLFDSSEYDDILYQL